jgi:hypothetical protein
MYWFYIDQDYYGSGDFPNKQHASCTGGCTCTSVASECIATYLFTEYEASKTCVAHCNTNNLGCRRNLTCDGTVNTACNAADDFCHLCADAECTQCSEYIVGKCRNATDDTTMCDSTDGS